MDLALGILFLANGVICEINDIQLFAKTPAECVQAGGVVTHTVDTEIKEVNTDRQ